MSDPNQYNLKMKFKIGLDFGHRWVNVSLVENVDVSITMLIATGKRSSGSKKSSSLTFLFACNIRADTSDQQESQDSWQSEWNV